MDTLKVTLDKSVNCVFAKLPPTSKDVFDAHDFIKVFLNLNEPVYANLFVRYKDVNGAFRSFHSTIDRYLNAIEKRGIIAKVIDREKKEKSQKSEYQRGYDLQSSMDETLIKYLEHSLFIGHNSVISNRVLRVNYYFVPIFHTYSFSHNYHKKKPTSGFAYIVRNARPADR